MLNEIGFFLIIFGSSVASSLLALAIDLKQAH
jgi:hypothetical protein